MPVFFIGMVVGILILNLGKSTLLEETGLFDEYTLYGRGAAVVYELLEADGPEDGALRVTARVYADSACIVPERTLLYTFRVSEPDGCEIVSCEELF